MNFELIQKQFTEQDIVNLSRKRCFKLKKLKVYECKWKTLFIIFQLPSTFKSVKKSVKL